jgi:hypothetical protein
MCTPLIRKVRGVTIEKNNSERRTLHWLRTL